MLDLAHIPEECIGYRARAAARAVSKVLDSRLAAVGLRATQFSVLIAVNQEPEASVATLARSLDLEASALLRNLAVLERQGLVTSDDGRGRRGKTMKLTSKGLALVKKGAKVWRKAQNDLALELSGKFLQTRSALRDIEKAARAVHEQERT